MGHPDNTKINNRKWRIRANVVCCNPFSQYRFRWNQHRRGFSMGSGFGENWIKLFSIMYGTIITGHRKIYVSWRHFIPVIIADLFREYCDRFSIWIVIFNAPWISYLDLWKKKQMLCLRIEIWDMTTSRVLRELVGHQSAVTSIDFNPYHFPMMHVFGYIMCSK